MRFLPIYILLFGAAASVFWGKSASAGPDSFTSETRSVVIAGLSRLLAEIYVIPKMADDLTAMLEKNEAAGRYDSATTREEFAGALTTDLQSLSGDLHLQVMPGDQLSAGPTRIVRPGPTIGTPEAGAESMSGASSGQGDAPVRVVRRGSGSDGGVFDDQVGIAESKLLPGNVGYVDIRLFVPREKAEASVAAEMAKIEGAEAVIFDLRMCSGGAPDMVHFVTSYLYPSEPKHLLTYYHAHEEPEKAWTLRHIPGQRMPDVPVYILTGPMTASGGEEFSYNLKHHGRATLVGQTTAGGGHGGSVHAVAAGFHAFVPDFRPVHPVTGKGWEGVGVVPHIETAQAKVTAYEHAIRTFLETADQSARRDKLEAVLAEIKERAETKAERASVGVADAKQYTGKFGHRTISFRNGALYLQRQGGPKLKMIRGDEDDTFVLDRVPQAQIRFSREDGEINRLHVLAMNGRWEETRKQ